jgi:hypothetical protein
MLNLPISFYTMHQKTDNTALINSGPTKSFLDEAIWRELNIDHFKMDKPLTINNINGTKNKQGKIEHYCWLKMYYLRKMMRMQFFLTDLGKDWYHTAI